MKMHISQLDTPAVLIDLDIMERNIQNMAEYCASAEVSLRPHIKTHKIPEIAQRQIKAGAIGITAAKPSEAAVMANAGIKDILIAYPIVSPAKAKALLDLIEKEVTVSVSLDSLEAAECLAQEAHARAQRISLLVELDVGFGRCGVATSRLAVSLAESIRALPGASFGGVMYYPGHLFLSGPEQDRLVADVNDRVNECVAALEAAGFDVPVVSGGSSPTARRSKEFTRLTEIRPGMYPLNDRNLVEGGFARLDECALTVLTTVVSTAVQGRAIVDGGSKTFSSDRLLTGSQLGSGLVMEDQNAAFLSMSEEHGHLDISKSSRSYKLGEKLRILPNHICTTINMHNKIYGIRKEMVEEVWTVAARGCVQ